jgi:hypothetical protein
LPPAERSAFVDEWDARSSDLKIADYEIVDLVARGDLAQVQVKISWYGEREGTLHDTHARQIWRRAGKIWLLTDEVRMRGAAMPGLAEPPPAAAADGAGAADGDDASRAETGEGAAGEGSASAGRARGAAAAGADERSADVAAPGLGETPSPLAATGR